VDRVLNGMIDYFQRQAASNCIQNLPAQVVPGEALEFNLGAYDPLRLTGSAELSPGTRRIASCGIRCFVGAATTPVIVALKPLDHRGCRTAKFDSERTTAAFLDREARQATYTSSG
jgi:hypothetical protein